jgi:hypothetical protein
MQNDFNRTPAGKLIPLIDYARLHGKTISAVRKKAADGGFKTARKIGRNWVISEEEPFIDLRFKRK